MINIGDIYKVIIYYKNKSSDGKSRSVLIINIDSSNSDICTIVEIASALPEKDNYYSKFKEEIKNWQQCGLNKPSYVKCKNIHNIETERLYEKIGTMKKDDLCNILCKIAEHNS